MTAILKVARHIKLVLLDDFLLQELLGCLAALDELFAVQPQLLAHGSVIHFFYINEIEDVMVLSVCHQVHDQGALFFASHAQ